MKDENSAATVASRCVLLLLLIGGGFGCGSAHHNPQANHAIFIVAGVGGANGYGSLADAVKNPQRHVEIVQWGSPIVFLNFSSKSVHDEAEEMLAKKLGQWLEKHSGGQIDLIGHRAGCGVILGALPRMHQRGVHSVILLAPSVSPSYDLTGALERVEGAVHVFHSEKDTTFLSWRTSTFGTYDRVKAKAAGNVGFAGSYPSDRLIQHPYDDAWKELGNDGGHFGALSRRFAEQVINPLIPGP